MYRILTEAAGAGDVEKLHNLIRDDPFLLRAANLADGDGTGPLHIACMGGHVDFTKQVLNLNPGSARELNRDGFTPLHIASANGDTEIVRELLEVGSRDLCMVRGKEMRIPLHYAVVRGRIEIIRMLVSVCSDSVREVTARGESCFHLAVRSNQFEAFKVLCEHVVSSWDEGECIMNVRDERGNTILHLAASIKQYEVVDLLLDEHFGYKYKLEVNALNRKGLTPLDVLISEGGDPDIEEMLRLSGSITNQETRPFPQTPQNSAVAHGDPPDSNRSEQERTGHTRHHHRPKSASKKLRDYFKYDITRDSPGKARDTLLVIAILIATATYQAVLSPPGGVWQDDFRAEGKNATATTTTTTNLLGPREPRSHTAGQAVMGTRMPIPYGFFLVFNSFGFYMSLHMMEFLTLGLPLQFELRAALFALIATYDVCMTAITPRGGILVFFTVLSMVLPVVMPLLTKVVRDFKKGERQCELPSTRENV
ncbi:hypothetical protein OROMI_017654 [Orobanche minor]